MSKMMLAAAAFAAILAGPALAQETQSTLVRTANVNFNDQAQVQAVYAKLQAAARAVCSTPSDNKYIAAPERDCVEKAMAGAVKSLDKPLLTAAYTGNTAPTSALAGNDQ